MGAFKHYPRFMWVCRDYAVGEIAYCTETAAFTAECKTCHDYSEARCDGPVKYECVECRERIEEADDLARHHRCNTEWDHVLRCWVPRP